MTAKNGHHVQPAGPAPTPAPPLPQVAAVKLTPRNHFLAAAELDTLDSAIAELDAAIAERTAAATLYDDADRKVRIIEERCRLLRLAVQVQLAAGVEA